MMYSILLHIHYTIILVLYINVVHARYASSIMFTCTLLIVHTYYIVELAINVV